MKSTDVKTLKRKRRHARIRAKVEGTADKPRLSVFRSNKFIYAQLIDDKKGVTLASASTLKSKKAKSLESAKEVGTKIAKAAEGLKIKKAVFDRAGFIFTGKIKAVAEGAREGGLQF